MVVAVQQGEVTPAGQGHAAIPGGRHACVVLPHVPDPAGVALFEHRARVIGGAVVDHHDLVDPAGLREHRVQGPRQQSAAIERGYNRRNLDRVRHAAGSRQEITLRVRRSGPVPPPAQEALAFFSRHYNVVSLEQVLDSAGRGIALPPRSLLITFDDGWSDNVDHALPELRLVGMPAVMFVVADAVGTRQPFFQERIVAAWRRGAITVEGLAAALDGPRATDRSGDEEDISMLRKAIARIELLDGAARDALLAPFADALDDGQRHMVDVDELRRLRAGGVALGLHGKTHVPMTRAADLDAELGGARERLAELLGDPSPTARSMSFPHGAYDPGIADSARRAGYDLVCTSVPVLNPVGPGVGWLMGRIGFDTESVVDRAGRFRRDWLALYMFRPPARRLA
ncbi:MAG: polysaccharide deacetylase family protein [Lysobacteraceae bacterium]|nr:MAG: polysaccharide deacetylase family protein [Xanthomonadaceae bacterium]